MAFSSSEMASGWRFFDMGRAFWGLGERMRRVEKATLAA
jgi:hypothetical protein